MDKHIDILKGILPGKIILRTLKKRNMSQRDLADSISYPYQAINAIIKGKRKLNTELSLKIERALDLEEGLLSVLQVYYDIKELKEKESREKYPNPPSIRQSVFWDTDFQKIDWEKNKQFVINRILQYGSETEIKEIAAFYKIEISDLKQYQLPNNNPITYGQSAL